MKAYKQVKSNSPSILEETSSRAHHHLLDSDSLRFWVCHSTPRHGEHRCRADGAIVGQRRYRQRRRPLPKLQFQLRNQLAVLNAL